MKSVRLYLFAAVTLTMLLMQMMLAQSRMEDSSDHLAASAPAGTLTPAAAMPASPPEGPSTVVMPDGHTAQVPGFKDDADTSGATRPVGRPAITPSIKNAGPTVPAFTQADILAYARAKNTNGVGRFRSTVAPSVARIEFVTERELRQRFKGATSGLADDALLCLVVYSGRFEREGSMNSSEYFSGAAEVFDARTGNLMVEGTGPTIR